MSLGRQRSDPRQIGRPHAPAGSSGTHNLLIAEVVNAHLKGRRLSQYQVVGELRALPVSVPSPPTEFRFRLKNTHRIEQLKVNEKFVKPVSSGEYLATLPATSSTAPSRAFTSPNAPVVSSTVSLN